MHPYRILLGVALALCLIAIGIGALSGDEEKAAPAPAAPALAQLPRGGRSILPENRVVVYYGAPGDSKLGILGIGSPTSAAIKLQRQTREYEGEGLPPAIPAMELITVIVTAAPGERNLHRHRQDDAMIKRYLEAARKSKSLLILDIQPGRADFLTEAKALEKYLLEPDVSLALDPEWRMGPDEIPGRVIGSVEASEVNAVSKWLSDLVVANKLPDKLFLIHQFTDGMVLNRQALVKRPGLDMVLNADGFGTPELKRATYERLSKGRKGIPMGFKLFFEEDTDLMSPQDVLALTPVPAVVMYE